MMNTLVQLEAEFVDDLRALQNGALHALLDGQGSHQRAMRAPVVGGARMDGAWPVCLRRVAVEHVRHAVRCLSVLPRTPQLVQSVLRIRAHPSGVHPVPDRRVRPAGRGTGARVPVTTVTGARCGRPGCVRSASPPTPRMRNRPHIAVWRSCCSVPRPWVDDAGTRSQHMVAPCTVESILEGSAVELDDTPSSAWPRRTHDERGGAAAGGV